MGSERGRKGGMDGGGVREGGLTSLLVLQPPM